LAELCRLGLTELCGLRRLRLCRSPLRLLRLTFRLLPRHCYRTHPVFR
jgi:hypothetical protein